HNSCAQTKYGIQIYAVDQRGEALIGKTRFFTYEDVDSCAYEVVASTTAFQLVDDYRRRGLAESEALEQDRRDAIEKELAKSGLRMEYDPGSIPGEGHVLVSIGTGEWADAPTDAIAALARQWSDLTDQAEADTENHLNLRDAAASSTEPRSVHAQDVDFDQANFVLYEKSSEANVRVTGIEEAIAAIDDAGPDAVLKVVVDGGVEQDVWRAAGDEYVDHAFSAAVEQVREARSFRP
ncbi:hypothetical protein PQQ76_25915, partial [Paraburkholderia sediminicola]